MKQVDLLKTDIEGSEFELLHGILPSTTSLPMQVGEFDLPSTCYWYAFSMAKYIHVPVR